MVNFNNTDNIGISRDSIISEDLDLYISPDTGDDTNSGESPSEAWLTVAPLVALLDAQIIQAGVTVTVNLDSDSAGNFGITAINVDGAGTLRFTSYGGNSVNILNLRSFFISRSSGISVEIEDVGLEEVRFFEGFFQEITINNFSTNRSFVVQRFNTATITNASFNSNDFSRGTRLVIDTVSTTNNLNVSEIGGVATINNVTLVDSNPVVFIESCFLVVMGGTWELSGTPRLSSSPRIINLEAISIARINFNLNVNGQTDFKILEAIDAQSVDWNVDYVNLPTGTATLNQSPIRLENTGIRFSGSTPYGTVSISNELFEIIGLVQISTFDETFNNLPYSYASSGLDAGTIVNFADAFEINLNSPDFTADNVRDALVEINNKIKRETDIYGAINANVGNTAAQDLRRQNGVPMNQAPYGIKYDAEIYQVIISNASINNYTIEVIINGAVQGTFTRSNGTTIEIFDLATPIPILKGDQLRLRFAGGTGSTQRPAAQLTYREI